MDDVARERYSLAGRALIYGLVAASLGLYLRGIPWKARHEYDFMGFAWFVQNLPLLVAYAIVAALGFGAARLLLRLLLNR